MHNESGEERVPAPAYIMQRCMYRLVDALNFDPRQGAYCISRDKNNMLQVHWVAERRPSFWLAWWYRLIGRKRISKSLVIKAEVRDGSMLMVMNPYYFDPDKMSQLMTAVVQHVMEQEQEQDSEDK